MPEDLKKPILIGAGAAFILIIALVTILSGQRFEYRFTELQIQEALSARLPLTKTYLMIFHVTLDNPRVTLIEETDRVEAGLDVQLNIRVAGRDLPFGGAIDASGAVDYVPEKGEFYLIDPIIEKLAIQGVPEKYEARVESVMTKALAEFYSTRPIYSLRDDKAAEVAAQLILKKVRVKDKELIITLGL